MDTLGTEGIKSDTDTEYEHDSDGDGTYPNSVASMRKQNGLLNDSPRISAVDTNAQLFNAANRPRVSKFHHHHHYNYHTC